MKLDGALADDRARGRARSVCGGGARLPQASARAARAGLAGLEFGVNIPGTVGGAVRMNANAYGGELGAGARVGRLASSSGTERRDAGRSSASPTGAPTSGRARSWRAPRSRSRAPTRRGEGHARRHARRARAAQPSGIKTFGSTFKNPDDPRAEGRSAGMLLDEAGCRGLQVGGARFSRKHANFVENMGEATTADVFALMAEGRRRVRERFGVELEPEVQLLGDVDRGARGRPVRAAAAARAALAAAAPRCAAAGRGAAPRSPLCRRCSAARSLALVLYYSLVVLATRLARRVEQRDGQRADHRGRRAFGGADERPRATMTHPARQTRAALRAPWPASRS